jgi:hypothetical protein
VATLHRHRRREEDGRSEPEEVLVPKYLFKASFSTDGVRGIAQEVDSAAGRIVEFRPPGA